MEGGLTFDLLDSSLNSVHKYIQKNDGVIQIANIVKIHGQKDPFIRNVFTLKSCA